MDKLTIVINNVLIRLQILQMINKSVLYVEIIMMIIPKEIEKLINEKTGKRPKKQKKSNKIIILIVLKLEKIN